MSALSLWLPDSVHRHINGRAYQQWAEVGQDVALSQWTIFMPSN